ncbi:MAG: AbrB/MazE/SpoVT family DNA-binding domain-containing protein [Candidatus Thiodiazotropha sp. (ex Dulcina madagascariensis)]|nr:AbrB/MazE/SpoVT family DNA-binding domain-containing protein [Candidatus Thiodiazotropha sp. (ex Dulcina madagascariensis)]
METRIRKIGNSTGAIIPAAILRKLHLKEGDQLSIEEQDGKIVLMTEKPKYSLKELLAKCDPTAPMPDDLVAWDNAQAVGNEKW